MSLDPESVAPVGPAEPTPDADAAIAVASDAAFEVSLGQAEIDRLTGFSPGGPAAAGAAPAGEVPPDGAKPAGVRAIMDGPAASRDILPMLGVAVDRFVAAAGATLARLLGPATTLSLEHTRPERYAGLLDELEMPTQCFCLRAEGWGGPALMTVGPGISHLVLDRLLGAAGDTRPRGFDDRPPTAIEAAILRKVVSAILRDADDGFGVVAPVAFAVDRVEPDPAEAAIAAPGDTVVAISLRLDRDGRGGRIGLVLPFSTLAPLRDQLAETFAGEAAGPTGPWSGHFATQVWGAPVAAEAVLHETRLSLGRVLALAVGDTLMFERKPGDLVTVRCGPVTLTRGRIGRVDGRIAVQVVEPLHPSTRPAGSRTFP